MPSSTRNEQGCERLQAGVVPEQGVQERVGAQRRQRVQPQLRVIGLAAPAVLVLGPVVDEQQDLGGGETLDQAVEQGLGLGVDPVQILADQEQGLHLAFAQQHALERREGALAALGWIKLAERAVVGQGVQERRATPGSRPGGPRPASIPARSAWPGWCGYRRGLRYDCSA